MGRRGLGGRVLSLLVSLLVDGRRWRGRAGRTSSWTELHVRDVDGSVGRGSTSYDIFEGTEQIQQLVISRAISGLRIE